jgi:hypothetical protein
MRKPPASCLSILSLFLGAVSALGADDAPLPVWPAGRELGANPGFEEGAEGKPSGWYLFQPPGGMRIQWGRCGISGTMGLLYSPPERPGPQVNPAGANQFLNAFEPGREIEVTAWIRLAGFQGQCVLWARCDGEGGPEDRAGAFQNSVLAGYDLRGTSFWTPVTVRVTPGDKTRGVAFGLLVGGTGTVEADEFRARVRETGERAAPGAAGPGLFLAEGRYAGVCSRDGESLRVWIPVPILWREQVPLTFRAWTEPEGLVASVKFFRRPHGFHFAELLLSGLKGNTRFSLSWESYVLALPHETRAIPAGIRVPVENVPPDVSPWLNASWCCDTNDPEIRKVAEDLMKGGPAADALVPALIERLGAILRAEKGRVSNLTASEAMTKAGSCTSNANLAAALFRAVGIPARVIAGYPTWSGPLQTHYVVEYWLPGAGWRLMESSLCRDDRPGAEQIEVAMVLPVDEAMGKAGMRPGAAGGVPFLSLTEYPDPLKDGAITVWLGGAMPGQPGCDHRATAVRAIAAEPGEWKAAADRLSKRWLALFGDAAEPAPDAAKLAGPKDLASASTLDAILKAMGG